MSLIADSLKKAVREKTIPVRDSGLGINVMQRGEALKHPGLNMMMRFFLLIVLPTAILLYLISIGAFNLRKPPVAVETAKIEPPREETPEPVVAETAKAAPVKREAVPPAVGERTFKKAPLIEPKKKVVAERRAMPEKRGAETESRRVIPLSPDVAQQAVPAAPAGKISAEDREETKVKTVVPQYPAEKKMEQKQALSIEVKENGQKVASLPPADSPDILITGPGIKEDVFKNSNYFFNRGLFFQQARDWEKALANYSKAEQLDPNNPDTYNNKGVVYKELGHYDQAIDEFLRAVYLAPNYPKAYNNIGVVYYMQKNYPEAIKNYQKAIDIHPENLEAFNNLAIVYKNQNEPEKARAVLNKALAMDPDHPGTNYNLAVLYEESAQIKPALHYYRRFVDLGAVSYPSLVFEVKEHIQTLELQ